MIPSAVRRSVSEYSGLLHQRGWVANHDGNVSARTKNGFLITPTATSKRLCAPDTLVECEPQGQPIGSGKPPSEVALHVAAYRRADVSAVIHAHPPHASAFALLGRSLDVFMPEVVVSLGDTIPLVPLLLPKDPATTETVAKALQLADVCLLAGNGVLAVGPDLETAYLRVELLEHYARIVTIARGLGEPVALDSVAKAKLLEMRAKAGLGRPAPEKVATDLRTVVAEEVRRALGGHK